MTACTQEYAKSMAVIRSEAVVVGKGENEARKYKKRSTASAAERRVEVAKVAVGLQKPDGQGGGSAPPIEVADDLIVYGVASGRTTSVSGVAPVSVA